jgi:hypothetical protein
VSRLETSADEGTGRAQRECRGDATSVGNPARRKYRRGSDQIDDSRDEWQGSVNGVCGNVTRSFPVNRGEAHLANGDISCGRFTSMSP